MLCDMTTPSLSMIGGAKTGNPFAVPCVYAKILETPPPSSAGCRPTSTYGILYASKRSLGNSPRPGILGQ